MKKRILSLALTLIICLGLAVPASAYDMAKAGKVNVVSAGSHSTGLIDAHGFLWMWGDNFNGQLGNGGSGNVKAGDGYFYQTVPVKVLDNVISVSCGVRHTAAIKKDGSLWMWGQNYDGQLGNNSTKDSLVPVKVLDNVSAVSCGNDYTAVIKTDGSLWMWGRNQCGQLGKGKPGDSKVPVKVMDNVTAVSCSSWAHTAAIKTDGSLWIWGSNVSGQLGNDYVGNEKMDSGYRNGNEPLTYPIQDVPVKIMDNVSAVSCGFLHTAAIKNDGALWTWGDNEDGELGNGRKYNAINWPVASRYQTVPVKVMDGVSSVNCGNYRTAAIKTDGSLWVWGDNGHVALGIGYTGNYINNQGHGDYPIQTIPIKLMDNVISVSFGTAHTIIVKKDGSVWGCGRTAEGQLGNGGKADHANGIMQTIPVKIPNLTAKLD